MRSILIILFFLLVTVTAKSQKWQAGTFTDVKGTRVTGQIKLYPSGKGPIKDEAFIEFKEDPQASVIQLSASELRSFTASQDSFVVAANGGWSKFALDFARVALNGPIRIFELVSSS